MPRVNPRLSGAQHCTQGSPGTPLSPRGRALEFLQIQSRQARLLTLPSRSHALWGPTQEQPHPLEFPGDNTRHGRKAFGPTPAVGYGCAERQVLEPTAAQLRPGGRVSAQPSHSPCILPELRCRFTLRFPLTGSSAVLPAQGF